MSSIHKAGSILIDLKRPVLICSEGHRSNGNADLEAAVNPKSIVEDAQKAAEGILLDAKRQSQKILEKASADASQILASAQTEANRLAEEAKSQGYAEGFERGRAEGQKEFEESCHRVLKTLGEIVAERNNLISGLEKEVIDLVLDMADKVIRYELDRNDDAFVKMIQSALSTLRAPGYVIIKVHPDLYPKVCRLTDDSSPGKGWMKDIHVEQDDSLDPFDCLIETGCGTLDVGISTQLEQIGKAFRQLMSSTE